MKNSTNAKATGDKRILITGGSNGLGLELTKVYLKANYEVIIFDIVPPKIIQEKLKYVYCNLSNLSEIEISLDKIGPVDLLINNAAIIVKKSFKDLTNQEISQQIAINIVAPSVIIAHLLKFRSATLKIVNISSSAALIPTPNASIYGASKAYLSRLSKNLNSEISDANVFNFEVSGMNTDFQKNAGIAGNDSKLLLNPERVAAIIYRKISRKVGKNYRIGITGKIFYLSNKIVPNRIHENVLGLLFRKLR